MRQWLKYIVLFSVITLLTSACAGGSAQNALFIAQGSIKADEVNLNSKLAGVIEEVLIEEGQEVKQGDILIRLDSRSLTANQQQTQAARQAALGQQNAAEAVLAAAQAQYAKALNGTRSQDLAQAQAAYELAAKTYERIQKLHESGAVSDSEMDQASTQYKVVQQTYEAAREGARAEDISAAAAAVSQATAAVEAAKGQVAQAQGAIEEVNSYVDDAAIKAPVSGRVTIVNVKAGELISTGMPLATISNLEKPWVELNVRETDLSRVALNQTVHVKLLAYQNETFTGSVVRINQKADFATKRSTSNNGELDINSFGVKVVIDNLSHAVYPGMTATVEFPNLAEGTGADHAQ
ncbi:MAG: efflux RND transporter periplasmic adaptor subunit [Peptococcaceae bacterium]|jgi:HlyD family secretion protein|nr:efflux RND transporter periplasmic adaptor subunit [Peptococcaceae bacterium]